MPNKPKEHRCPKPGCDRVYKQRPDYIAHYGKCVLGVFDALKCPNCSMGFSNRHKWGCHKRNCKPSRSLLLPLEQRIRTSSYDVIISDNEYNDPLEELIEEHLVKSEDDDDYYAGQDDEKEFIMLPKQRTISQLSVPDIGRERGKTLCEELKKSLCELPGDATKSAYIYMLVDPSAENFCNGIFYISEGDSMQPLDHLRDAVEARRGSDHALVMTDDHKVQSNALAKIDKIWSIWNSGRGVGVVKPIEFFSKYQAATYEACLMSHMWLQLKNVYEGTLYGIAANWSQEDQSDVAEYLLNIIESLVNLTGLREIRLEDIDIEIRDED